ncbi:MAG: serine/threonine-protein phosphatase [Spirochaetes bacterium]|nr:serine/threonine-protein phosphatase [Spirochaetota bacterium]
MRNRFIKTLLLIVIILSNSLLLKMSWDLASNYPFDRLVIDGTLSQSLSISNKSRYYNAEIININGTDVRPGNIIRTIFSEKVTSYKLKLPDSKLIFVFEDISFNYNLFAFLFFMLFFGNIHLLWGITIGYIGSHIFITRQFSRFLIFTGLFFICSVIEIFKEFTGWSIIVLCFLMTYIFMKAAIHFSKIKSKNLWYLISKIILFISAISIFFIRHFTSSKFTHFIVINITGISLILLMMFFLTILFTHNLYNRLGMVITYSIATIGIFLPLASFSISMYSDFPVPSSFVSALSIFAPIVIGNYLISTYINPSGGIKKKFHTKIILDSCTAAIAAVFIFEFAKQVSYFKRSLVLSISLLVVFSVILYIRNYILSKLNRILLEDRDVSTSSLQEISELATQPIEISERFKKIYKSVSVAIDVDYVYFILFKSETVNESTPVCENYVKILNEKSVMYSFFKNFHHPVHRKSILTEKNYTNFLNEKSIDPRTELIVPIRTGDTVGAICCGIKTDKNPFYKTDIMHLTSTGMIIYHMIENEILFNHYVEKSKYERELDIASFVQYRLHPREVISRGGISIAFFSRPFIKVTGDFFDFISINKNKTAVIIGDVAGHGLPASMIMAVSVSLLRLMFEETLNLEEITNELNDFFINRYSGMELITVFIGIFNRQNMTLEYINAGHCQPVIINRNNNTYKTLDVKNHMIGVLDRPEYSASSVKLTGGDEIILYTDGLTEIQIDNEENVGEKIIKNIINKNREYPIDEKIEAFSDYVDKINPENIKDDITVIGIEIL